MKYFLPYIFLLLSTAYTTAQNTQQNSRQQTTPGATTIPGARVAQASTIKGIVQSAKDGTTLPGATVLLLKTSDGSTVTGAVTDANGIFRFDNVAAGQYTIKIDYIGFQPFTKAVQVQQQPVDVGILSLQEESTTMQEVVVVGRIPPGVQKGDTTQFNAAAFKTAPDASTQDLVQKMPGITIEDGQVQAQGETVQRILIDGKPFFGSDVDAALQNLPADVVANIQIYDMKSDKAELSGFDDGERIRTLNIVTKPEARRGEFGKVTAGYGTDNAYMVGANVNFFKNDRLLTLTGLSNNINQLSFSADPEDGGESNTQDGLIKTNAFGLNYANTWFEKVELAGSYSFTHRSDVSTRLRLRDFVQASQEGQVYAEESDSENSRGHHNMNMRLDYKINEQNRIRVRTRGSLFNNSNNSYFMGRTSNEAGLLNETKNTTEGEYESINFNNNIVYSHRFPKQGRSMTFRLNNSYSNSEGDRYRLARSIFYDEVVTEEPLNQYSDSYGRGFSWETELSYTEPIGKFSQVELEYEIGNRVNDSDQRTYDYDEEGIYEEDANRYTLLNRLLSNTFTNEYLSQETELGYRYNNEVLFLQIEGEYQHARLYNEQEYPATFAMGRTFTSFLPSVRMRYKFSESKNLEFNYDTRTNAPSINQLQDVVNNSNPLQFRTGNSDLRQSFRNWFRIRYRGHNPETNHNFYVSLESSLEDRQITNSTFIADSISVINNPLTLSNGRTLKVGEQLIRPVNLNGYRDIRSYFSYGFPVNAIQSNLNLRGFLNHSRRPGLVNDELNFVTSNRVRFGINISSNISERVDFNISTHSTYNFVENTLRPTLNNNYFTQRTRLWYNWIFGDGFVYRTNFSHRYNSGLAEGYNQNILLWNMSIGKKLFARDLGEISINVYDLLKQNNNIWRNITETYIEDVEANVLKRYFMLTFTYNIRNFGGGAKMEDYLEKDER